MSRRSRRPRSEGSHERWLVSYADFITLLFAFFVVMFASSQADKGRAKQVSDSVSRALTEQRTPAVLVQVLGGVADDRGRGNAMMQGPGGTQKIVKAPEPAHPIDLQVPMQVLNKELESEIKAGQLRIILEPRGLVISLKQGAFFPSAGADLDPATYTSLEKVATVIRNLPNHVLLEGHTDKLPIHNARFKSNWELSAARGIALLKLFTEQFDIPETRLSIAGHAGNVPVDTNDTEAGRSRNRRVDIVVLNQNVLLADATGATPPPAAK